MKACIVKNKNTEELYRFTLGEKGDIIITDNKLYDLDDLIVSLVEPEMVKDLDNSFFVMVRVEYGE